MEFLTAAWTDTGIHKECNEDSYCIKMARTGIGMVVMAAVCDGMGGLEKGEVASASVIEAFSGWFDQKLPGLLRDASVENIEKSWSRIIEEQNAKICEYGKRLHTQLGTTLTVLLILDSYAALIGHVGDSRAYKINDSLTILTEDQTLVNRELKNGILTPEQAREDNRRNILLQCIGAAGSVRPDYLAEGVEEHTTYMLCSDGFRHELTEQEIFEAFHPDVLTDEEQMRRQAWAMVELNKERMERDNITVLLIRTM